LEGTRAVFYRAARNRSLMLGPVSYVLGFCGLEWPGVNTVEAITLGGVIVAALVGLPAWFQWWSSGAGNRRPVTVGSARQFGDRLPDDRHGVISSPDDQSMVRIAPVFISNRSTLAQEVNISERSRVLWPRMRPAARALGRRVSLEAGEAGNVHLMFRSRNWVNGQRPCLLLVRGETVRGQPVRGVAWTRLTNYRWAEPPGFAS
jgi:hypothetical protein